MYFDGKTTRLLRRFNLEEFEDRVREFQILDPFFSRTKTSPRCIDENDLIDAIEEEEEILHLQETS